jgi:hypothetical protein
MHSLHKHDFADRSGVEWGANVCRASFHVGNNYFNLSIFHVRFAHVNLLHTIENYGSFTNVIREDKNGVAHFNHSFLNSRAHETLRTWGLTAMIIEKVYLPLRVALELIRARSK